MDKIKEVREYKFPNATVIVRIPELTPEEYEIRHRLLEKAAEEILKEKQDADRERAAMKKEEV